ncbi:bifunctional DNA-formamidopyrimidine glycosylase/DNA-(apurinic or apyrimidinic site) lyase [Candidatus Gracilibacteria bacterium]|nr:bifunctional DNA-formamidopyrimidine glycosylase/DNA-(apurinic or apyrimidinic site) lyase [Candidatus Gracilibacteria bacterium]
MPELPEVETVVNDLRPILVGKCFEGLPVLAMARRGKFIVIFLAEEKVLVIHLRMTGRLIVAGLEDEAFLYERRRLEFGDVSVRFCDQRKFGRVWLCDLADYEKETGIWKLGLEPLDEDFSAEKFVAMMRGRKGTVKKWLLDQTLVAGIGNIYADEACFYAGVRPDAEMSRLTEADLERLYDGVLKALNQGVRNRGTSVKDYADAYGKSGKNQEVLFVYGRGGKGCLACGELLMKCKVAGRGTVYCGECQS